ncbi:NAD(P)-binding protein [Lizonia empirigonia]|nr:NAD(P)-binding protein [Lizonia empirigonia]
MSLDRYATIHAATPSGRGDRRPTAEQVLRDQGFDRAYGHDKVFLITGGTAGLGKECARVLHKTGARIFITGRDVAKGQRVAESIGAANPSNPPVEVIEMDHSSLESVRNAVRNFLEMSQGKVNVVMANAGIVASTVPKTADGFEAVFGINYLATFLFVQLLVPALLASTTPAFNSRLVVVSSAGHRASNIDPENYNAHGVAYSASKAYAQSKTALILMANEFERRYASRGVHALSLNPGVIMGTEISRDLPGTSASRRAMYYKMFPLLEKWEKDTEQGAATQVWASIAKELEGKGGLYLDDVQVARETEAEDAEQYCLPGYRSWIWDEEMATKLWRDSFGMVGLSIDGDAV